LRDNWGLLTHSPAAGVLIDFKVLRGLVMMEKQKTKQGETA
jgi:hypothetical protein